MANLSAKIGVEFLHDTRVPLCWNSKCKFNRKGDCDLKETVLNDLGMCIRKETIEEEKTKDE